MPKQTPQNTESEEQSHEFVQRPLGRKRASAKASNDVNGNRAKMEKQLTEIGFEIEKKEDITQPVLRAINVLADIRKYCAGTSLSPKKYINNFLAVEDSSLNEGFKSGYIKYLFYTLKNK